MAVDPAREFTIGPTRSELAERIDLTVHTPNEQLFGRLQGRYDVTITIAAGWAERAGDQETAVQLGRLCRLIFLHRAAALTAIDRDLTRFEPTQPPPPSPVDLEFQRRYEQIAVSETSYDGSLTLGVVGLSSWVWDVAPGSVDRLGSHGVAEAATEVANKVAWALEAAVRELKVETYHGHS